MQEFDVGQDVRVRRWTGSKTSHNAVIFIQLFIPISVFNYIQWFNLGVRFISSLLFATPICSTRSALSARATCYYRQMSSEELYPYSAVNTGTGTVIAFCWKDRTPFAQSSL